MIHFFLTLDVHDHFPKGVPYVYGSNVWMDGLPYILFLMCMAVRFAWD